ncbi:MAG: hypothetical protein QW308_03935 [Candidatus Woesearchaeota archaeon]
MEMEEEVKKEIEVEILNYDYDRFEPPCDGAKTDSVYLTLQVGERKLHAEAHFYWEFSASHRLTWDGERFEIYGFDISSNINILKMGIGSMSTITRITGWICPMLMLLST